MRVLDSVDELSSPASAESLAQRLSQSETLLDAVLGAINNGVLLVGPDSTVLYANRKLGELFAIDPRIVLGLDRRLVVERELSPKTADPEAFVTSLAQLYEQPERTDVIEIDVVQPSARVLELFSAPMRSVDGRLVGRIEVYSDLTEVRQLQRNKEEFLSVVSHELRTPVTSIKGYAQLLQRRAQKEPTSELTLAAYATIERQANKMEELIELLLDVSRLERGRLRLQVTNVDLNDLVTRVATSTQLQSDQHHIEVSVPARHVVVPGDGHRLEQALVNVFSNAVRFSPDGGDITATLTQSAEIASIAIEDHGIGIATDDLERIFERFYRDDDRVVTSGLGVGLYITKGIIERHGGRIDVTSEPGRGSIFTLTLPLQWDETAGGAAV